MVQNIVERVARKIEEAQEKRAFGLYDYSSYPGIEPPHVVRDEINRTVVLRTDDSAAARSKYDSLCRNFVARAAIIETLQAMREPSEGMKLAGGLKCEAIMFEDEGPGDIIFNDMGQVFTAMIDAQIKEMEEAG